MASNCPNCGSGRTGPDGYHDGFDKCRDCGADWKSGNSGRPVTSGQFRDGPCVGWPVLIIGGLTGLAMILANVARAVGWM